MGKVREDGSNSNDSTIQSSFFHLLAQVIRGHQRSSEAIRDAQTTSSSSSSGEHEHSRPSRDTWCDDGSSGWTPKTLDIDVVETGAFLNAQSASAGSSWVYAEALLSSFQTSQLFTRPLPQRKICKRWDNSGSETIDGGLRWTLLWAACQREYCHWTCAE